MGVCNIKNAKYMLYSFMSNQYYFKNLKKKKMLIINKMLEILFGFIDFFFF